MLEATMAILNANVITLNPRQPRAQAIAVYNGKIVAVGSNEEIRKHMGQHTKILRLKNKTVIPGFVDCHVHMTSLGWSLQSLDLRNARSIKEIQRRLRQHANKNPEKKWILGGRWDQEKFAEERFPTRWDLDAAVKDKPVFLTRVCGHAGVVNTKALQLAGITAKTTVKDGKIELDKRSGEPNGVLKENALELIWKAIPKPTPQELKETCLNACRKANEVGITGVHWLVDSAEETRTLQQLYSEGKLSLRVYMGIPAARLDELTSLGLFTGFGNDSLRIGFVKIFADGSLGARTAALKEPYADKPETKGMLLITEKKLDKLISEAHRAGLQLGVHAIGDRAIEAVLKAFAKVLEQSPRADHRHRIEHCSVLNPHLIKHFRKLGLTASVQPHFIVSDFWVKDRVGKARARWVYPFKTLMNKGIVVVAGSDCPVEPINPLLGIWAATTRRDFQEEKLTVEEALRTYTMNAAYASYDEDKKGTIEAGKLADLTVLSKDLLDASADAIKDIQVEMTIVDGKVVYAH